MNSPNLVVNQTCCNPASSEKTVTAGARSTTPSWKLAVLATLGFTWFLVPHFIAQVWLQIVDALDAKPLLALYLAGNTPMLADTSIALHWVMFGLFVLGIGSAVYMIYAVAKLDTHEG